jgi:two-component system response regulator HydG
LAFGVDVDDDPIADAARKLELDDAVAEAGDTVRYQRELATRAGRGSRLVSIAANTALVLEHRFRTSAFDALDGDVLRSWNVVGGVLMRGSSPIGPVALPVRSSSASEESLDVTTTVVPARERRREFTTILGSSPALARALAKLDGAIDSDLPVVLSGETGTGKELFARALHDYGRRASRPFVAVNCAAIADALFEAELFGHARGAFTGADRARPGLLARAEGGTLFLDEIGELSLARQATLLRALETRMLRPVGSDDERPFDVRVVCATHRDLDEAVRQGQFRADLLFRLRVLAVEVPALRDREDDILVLARAFLRRAGSRAAFTKPAEELVRAYEWPGNVRELAHVCERLATLEVDRVEARHLPRALRARRPDRPTFADDAPGAAAGDPKGEIERALSLTNGNISHAASALGLTRQGLKKKMVRLGLRKKGA